MIDRLRQCAKRGKSEGKIGSILPGGTIKRAISKERCPYTGADASYFPSTNRRRNGVCALKQFGIELTEEQIPFKIIKKKLPSSVLPCEGKPFLQGRQGIQTPQRERRIDDTVRVLIIII